MARKKSFHLLLILSLILLLGACSKHIHQVQIDEVVLYPSPPDTARIQFLTRYGNSTDLTGGQSKFKSFVVGPKAPIPIVKPYGIAIQNNKIFIADPGIAGLQIINLDKETFESFTPGGRGTFKLPLNCFVDPEGYVYVADAGRKQIVIFNETLDYTGEIGGDKDFRPVDVFLAGDTILVTDPDNNRVRAYSKKSHELLFTFPENVQAGDKDWLYNPINIWVNQENIFITDFGHSSIKIFSHDGSYLRSIGSYGKGLGQFARPKGIAVDKKQNLFVVDAGFQNVQVFNNAGELLMFFGGPYKGPGDMYLPANVTIDYDHLQYYEKFVAPEFKLEYLIFVTNQYGPDKVSVYGRVEPR